MRHIFGRAFALSTAVALVAAACGGGAAPPAQTATTPPPAAATTAPAAAAGPTFGLSTHMYAMQAKKKIRIATQEDNPPFSRKDPLTNTWEGFDVDFGREVAKALFGANADLNAVIEWVPVTSATRIGVLQENKADIVIKTFTINEDRKKQIDFSDIYFFTGQRILVKKDSTVKSIQDLSGKTVCAQAGSTSEKNITTANPAARTLLQDSYPACLLALQQGSADAVSTDETILFGLVGRDPNTKIVGPYFSEEPYGIGVAKNKTGTVGFLSGVIAAMVKDGRWEALYKKHIAPVSGDTKTSPKDTGKPA